MTGLDGKRLAAVQKIADLQASLDELQEPQAEAAYRGLADLVIGPEKSLETVEKINRALRPWVRFNVERVLIAEEADALKFREINDFALLAPGRDPNAPTGRWEGGDFAFRLIPLGLEEHADPEFQVQYEWDDTYEDEEGRGGWIQVGPTNIVTPELEVTVPPGTVLGDPAGRPLNNHFGPSGTNSASSPNPRNHSTIAICGGTSVP